VRNKDPRHAKTKSVAALALSYAAGFTDIVGAITVYDLFTAHISGTTVRLAQHVAERRWTPAALAAIVVAAFFLASLVGRVLIEAAQRRGFKRVASITMAIEILLLVAVVVLGNWSGAQPSLRPFGATAVLLALLAGAMGLQTASLTKIGPLTVHTTFLTGMVNKLAQLASLWLFAKYDLHRSPRTPEMRPRVEELATQIRFFLGLWMLYFSGAISGTFSAKYGLRTLYFPCIILLAIVAVDQARPLSIEEEQEQAQ
jgi:uncharacterized membrane protein YoaK (UPF0700 family)